jgi:GTPase SAR1 family protein
MQNPFNPSFGRKPERFIGRTTIVHDILEAIEFPNSPWRTTLLVGVRGSGKTALLSRIQKSTIDEKVICISVTPDIEFLDNVLGQLFQNIPRGIKDTLPQITGVSTGLGVKFDLKKENDLPTFTSTFRYQITELLKVVRKKGYSVIFLLDETQKHTEDMRTFVSTYQHLIREEYPVSLVMASLPNVISDILNDDILTFLRRAKRVHLEYVDVALVKLDYQEVFANVLGEAGADIVGKAATATYGYPYLIQLMGFFLWDELNRGINIQSAYEKSIIQAKAELFINVHELLFQGLSNLDKEFIYAMAVDTHFSQIKDISDRMEKKMNYISNYRARLLATGLIKEAGHGKVTFVLPYTREYLTEKHLNQYG